MQDASKLPAPEVAMKFRDLTPTTAKVQWYDKEKAAYNAFFLQKLKEIKIAEEQAREKDENRKEAKKRRKLTEKLLAGDRFLDFLILLPSGTRSTQPTPILSSRS